MVRSMFQYKNKIDHLKQEKAELTINYEVRNVVISNVYKLCVAFCRGKVNVLVLP